MLLCIEIDIDAAFGAFFYGKTFIFIVTAGIIVVNIDRSAAAAGTAGDILVSISGDVYRA